MHWQKTKALSNRPHWRIQGVGTKGAQAPRQIGNDPIICIIVFMRFKLVVPPSPPLHKVFLFFLVTSEILRARDCSPYPITDISTIFCCWEEPHSLVSNLAVEASWFVGTSFSFRYRKNVSDSHHPPPPPPPPVSAFFRAVEASRHLPPQKPWIRPWSSCAVVV